MTTAAALTELLDALEEQSDSVFAYLDRETGAVVVMTDESLSLAKYKPQQIQSLPEWQKEQAQVARQIETTDRYLSLPDRFDVNEWSIMRDFCDQVKPEQARITLQNVVHGNHASRRFKEQLLNLNLRDQWYQSRASAFEEILRDWCQEHDITLVTGSS